MPESRAIKDYLSSESESQRLHAIDSVISLPSSLDKDLSCWELLFQLPSRTEKARLAHCLRLDLRPTSAWSLATALLKDSEQDVIGNTINALTLSKNRVLAHRIQRFFSSPERPQRILYCLARYAEEAIDPRFASYLSPNLASDLSDAFLARTFNALFRLGVVDRFAIDSAAALIESHIDATNMDRKAAVSAILYLFFAGNSDDLKKLKSIAGRVGIPELRRLLNWGFATAEEFLCEKPTVDSGVTFFKNALRDEEPNFTGFGCLSRELVTKAFHEFLGSHKENNWLEVTRVALNLGDAECLEALAAHKVFGIEAAIDRKQRDVLELWRKHMPVFSCQFMASVKTPANYAIWHEPNPELLLTLLTADDFCKDKGWQSAFDNFAKNPNARLDILCAQLLALERIDSHSNTKASELEAVIQRNIKALIKDCSKDFLCEARDRILGTILGGQFSRDLVTSVVDNLHLAPGSWQVPALGFSHSSLDKEVFKKTVLDLISKCASTVQDPNLSLDTFIENVRTILEAAIQGFADKGADVAALHAIGKSAIDLQALLSALNANDISATKNEEEDDEYSEGADWSGRVAQDAPLLRWNAVLQVLSRTALSDEEKESYEDTLIEGMRVAPHVEKRWLVRALVRLGTDDCIKAVLYQAFQHVDAEFVIHTIRELLPSKHPRAQQALIRCVGRNTVNDELKLTILEDISLENPEDILQELKTLEILRLPQHIDEAIKDAVGRVAALVSVERREAPEGDATTTADVDSVMRQMLPEIDLLSVDTRSALRTAEMILIQSKDWGAEAVDLSPIVNMHFKAVELTMREVFEPYTDAVIRKGVLSRKLDLLGYARPIPEKMQVFEDYLASLPVIRTIPYFSKFKLRKMLRAICLYRPGKRFTLDGPKAFALFFLVSSRKKCPHGLDHILDLDFKTDNDLFEFIKLVHSLQDSRNRAVHEGLTWEAKDEIEAMRRQAYRIIEQSIRLAKQLQKLYMLQAASGNGRAGA